MPLTERLSRGGKTGRKVLGEIPATADPQRAARPFAHPRYWDEFILIGDPE